MRQCQHEFHQSFDNSLLLSSVYLTFYEGMNKKILRDPETGEIVGATRVPFLKAKLESKFSKDLPPSGDKEPELDIGEFESEKKLKINKVAQWIIAFLFGVAVTILFLGCGT
tara:strand:- start:71 stop:406 length:336 start_codon:yes stop_codon:yes gene_type:complete